MKATKATTALCAKCFNDIKAGQLTRLNNHVEEHVNCMEANSKQVRVLHHQRVPDWVTN